MKMVTDVQLLIVLACTILGGLLSWFAGWKDTHTTEPFNFNKAQSSIIRIVIASVATVSTTYIGFVGEVTVITYFGAFLAGAAIDSLGNRIAGILNK